MDKNGNKDEQATKKRKLSLSLSGRRRFNATSKEAIEAMCTPMVAKNFTDWFNDYNTRNEAKPCPDAVLTPTCSAEVLNKTHRIPIFGHKKSRVFGTNHCIRQPFQDATFIRSGSQGKAH